MTAASPVASFLVTGANRGIGLELARQALARGDHVVATCRDPGAADALHALVEQHPGALTLQALDVTSGSSVDALVHALGDRAIDVLVNNAGISGGDGRTLADMDYDAWAQVLETNTIAPFRIATALLPALRRSSRPRIMTISSLMGSLSGTSTGSYAYRSSKAAVNKVMRGLAEELRPDGIVVLPVHPGWVRTDMGGPAAPVSVEDSAAGLLSIVDRLTLAETGRFLAWDGEELPW